MEPSHKSGKKDRRRRLRNRGNITLPSIASRGDSLAECFPIFVEVAIGSVFGYVALTTFNRWYATSREASEFVLRPAGIMFFVLPLMASLALSTLLHERMKSRFFTRVLKREIPDSWQSPLLEGFYQKILAGFATIALAACVSLVPAHSRFTEGHIATQAMWPMPERRHLYTDVKTIALAYYYSPPSGHSRGGWSKERALYLRFQDGAIWTTMTGLAEAPLAERKAIANVVSRLSGVPFEYPELGDTRCCSDRPVR